MDFEKMYAGIFESHAHYTDEAFDEDRDELLANSRENGIEYIIEVGASMESTRECVALAAKYDNVYAAVGVHPSDTAPLTDDFIDYMRQQVLNNKKVVAIGEIGLDYYWNEPEPEIQKKWFIKQLDLAVETGAPVIIHSRDAAKDTLDILSLPQYKGIRGVIHCYSYSPEMAQIFLKMGYHIGVGGVVTFKNAKKLVETVEMTPLDRILTETDSPYMAPVPNRGTRNDSRNIRYVADKIAELKGVSVREVIDTTNENARKLFMIDENVSKTTDETAEETTEETAEYFGEIQKGGCLGD